MPGHYPTTDLQGGKLINGVHEDLHNNPEYKKRFEEMLKKKKNNKGKFKKRITANEE